MEKKQKKSLNSVALMFIMIVVIALLTYIIPSGSYTREVVNGKSVVDPTSFTYTDSANISPFDIVRAVPNGIANAVSMVVAVLLIGGGMAVLTKSDSLNIGISRIVKKVGVNSGDIILVILALIFAVLGAFLGFAEGSIPFIPITLSIAVTLGYDPLVGCAIVIVGAFAGFIPGPTNPNTVGFSQTLAGLPMYSGMGYRMIILVVYVVVCMIYILRYARREKKNPAKSLVAEVDASDLKFDIDSFGTQKFELKHALSLLVLLGVLVTFVYGASKLGWGFYDLGALYVLMAVLVGIFHKYSINTIAETFIKGAQDMVPAALMFGVAYGISWIMTKANILDTLVYWASSVLQGLPAGITIIGVFIVIALINLVIPSGSGKAMIVMPIVLPLAQILHIESQVAILAYQFGDGITNMCTPLSGMVLLTVGMAHVPYNKWLKFAMPLIGILIVISAVFLLIAQSIGYC